MMLHYVTKYMLCKFNFRTLSLTLLCNASTQPFAQVAQCYCNYFSCCQQDEQIREKVFPLCLPLILDTGVSFLASDGGAHTALNVECYEKIASCFLTWLVFFYPHSLGRKMNCAVELYFSSLIIFFTEVLILFFTEVIG